LSQLQTNMYSTFQDSGGPVTLKLTDRLSVRVYKDCRPSYLETSDLQKGLVLMLDGKELIEEGMGFGVPIIKYEDKTFFSRTADLSFQKSGSSFYIKKVFTLDAVSLKKFGEVSYIDDDFYTPLRKVFQMLYLRHKKLTGLFNKFMEIRNLANIKTEFVIVKPRGTVTVTYHCRPTAIDIQVDFSGINLTKCVESLVLNEQGSSVFQKYFDSNNLALSGNKIGAWETVTADNASLVSENGQLSFTARKTVGAQLFRGWEQTRNRFSWAGLSYSMQPTVGFLNYSIMINFKNK
jgi:hypothetical protein